MTSLVDGAGPLAPALNSACGTIGRARSSTTSYSSVPALSTLILGPTTSSGTQFLSVHSSKSRSTRSRLVSTTALTGGASSLTQPLPQCAPGQLPRGFSLGPATCSQGQLPVQCVPNLCPHTSRSIVRSARSIPSSMPLARDRVPAILVFPSILIYRQRKAIAEFAIKQRIPTMSGWKDFAIDGNLMTYGPDIREAWRHVATYVDKILKGSKPADLPVEEPTKLELAINLRTAKAIGLTIPPTVLARADAVIE